MLGLIWAQANGGVIGMAGDMPWSLPEDMRHFVAVTRGHPVIMGRRTWDSLQLHPLPGRLNVVVSRSEIELPEGAVRAVSIDEAVALAEAAAEHGQVWGMGGATLYTELIDRADLIELTEIDLDVDGDTHAPAIGPEFAREPGDWLTSSTGLRYRFTTCHRTRLG